MKKLLVIIFLAIITIGCNESEKTGAFLTAKIDGVAYTFNDKVNLNTTAELSHIVNGYNKELQTRITLGLNLKNQKTGTFELKENMVFVYHSSLIYKGKKTYYTWHAKKSVLGSTGTITITKNNETYMEGTFLFKGVGSTKVDKSVKNITEGKFKVFKK